MFANNRKVRVMKPILTIVLVAALALAAGYAFNESQKSDLEKAAEDVSDTMEDIADDLEN